MKFKFVIPTILITAGAASAQNFDVTGTDYNTDKGTTQTWVEDASNLYVEMAKSFACIIADSRPDLNPRGTWVANIDEAKCGISDGRGKTVASAILTSSRASNSSPQEVSAWFTASNGNKYVVAVTLKQSKEDLAPYGEWDFAYYLYETPEAPGMTFTSNTSPSKGWVVIKPEGDDVVVEGWDRYSENNYWETIRGKFIYLGGSLANAKFIGRDQTSSDLDDGEGQVGSLNANAYYQVAADFANGDVVSGSITDTCFARGNTWKTSWRTSLYDYSDGSRIELRGAFPFTSADSENISTRGWYDKWGAWIENQDALLSPGDTMSIVNQDNNTAYTLAWSGGRLQNEFGKFISRDPEFANSANPTLFTCSASDGCFVSNNNGALPYTHAAFASGNAGSSNASAQYLLTPIDEAILEPLTLYHDSNSNGQIDQGEKPVRWDFASTWSEDAEYQSYSDQSDSGDTFYMGNNNNNDGRGDQIQDWPYRRMKLSLNGETYYWSFEPFPWSPTLAARDANGKVYEMDEPISASRNYNFSSDDVNGSINSFTFYNSEGANNDAINDNDCTPAGNGCTFTTTANFVNGNLDFEYDGSTLRAYGIEGEVTQIGQNDEWLQLVNPKTSTVLTDMSDQTKKYVVVQQELGEFFIPEANNALCTAENVTFTSLSDLGLSLSDVPDENDFTFPTITWNDKPALSEATCEVTEGVPGQGC